MPRRRTVVAIAGIVVLLVAGVVASATVALRYAHGSGLVNQGGVHGWDPPDNLKTRFVDLGSYNGLVTDWRRGQRQAFVLDITNNSSVTQTVLGLAGERLFQERLDVSAAGQSGDVGVRYVPLPVAIAPHETRLVRYSIVTPPCGVPHARMSFDQLALRVRVGWFTRTETVSFGNTIYELRAPANSC